MDKQYRQLTSQLLRKSHDLQKSCESLLKHLRKNPERFSEEIAMEYYLGEVKMLEKQLSNALFSIDEDEAKASHRPKPRR